MLKRNSGIKKSFNAILLTVKNNILQNCQADSLSIRININPSPDNLDSIVFEENVINFDPTSNNGIGMFIGQSNRDVNIRICSFTHWASSFIAENFKNVVIEDCKFNE